MIVTYDNSFNLNEWIDIISLISGLILVWRFRRRFSRKEVCAYFLFGAFIGMLFDHTISIKPFDFYDVNDNSSYQLEDFVTYITYGPYAYFFVYNYDYLKIKYCYTPIYILFWAILSILLELFAHYTGIFHYKNGYKIYYSFPIYLLVFTSFICLYKLLNKKDINSK